MCIYPNLHNLELQLVKVVCKSNLLILKEINVYLRIKYEVTFGF